MADKSRDRVEALRSGDVSKALNAYAEFVADAIEQQDVTMVADLLMQLECVLAERNGRVWSEGDEKQAENLVRDVLRHRESTVGEEMSRQVEKLIEDGKSLARDNIDRVRKRAMKSVTDVERDKAERWGKD
jgi:hypothetical protein